jgi:N-acetylneuraminate synthase
MGCFLIAEAGVNHNGSSELAEQLIEVAARCGADAVKFQTFNAEDLVVPGTQTAAYQRANADATDQLEMLRQLELPTAALPRLKAKADACRIEFMSTPFDTVAARTLVGLGMQRIKVASGEITNLPFLADLARLDLPLIVSTGMATLDEVQEAVQVIASTRQESGLRAPLEERITLLHCTSNYPARYADVNLRAMATMRARFSLPVGYSDHTAGTAIAVAAVALGATVIEKHFTLDRELPGPDHKASLVPDELARMVTEIRAVEAGMGDGVKQPQEDELPVRALVRRSIVLAVHKQRGERVEFADLALLRPGTGLPPRDLRKVVGRRLMRSLPPGTLLSWNDLGD